MLCIHSKMPSSYHEHCGKPGPKSNDYMPPAEARMFKSRSAPNSPCLERKPLFPRSPRLSRSPKLTRAATLLAEKRLADKLRENKNPRFGKLGRSKSFGSSKSKFKNLFWISMDFLLHWNGSLERLKGFRGFELAFSSV